jgi:magnesium chelatase subunit D
MTQDGPGVWSRALHAAALLAIDPTGLGGVVLRSRAGPVRDRWLDALREMVPDGRPVRRLPVSVTDDRLLGGLDLAATLKAGFPVAERGLLADADGGLVVAAMAERMSFATAARLALALDQGAVRVERDGLSLELSTRFGLVALDEGLEDEAVPGCIADRLAFHVDLEGLSLRDARREGPTADEIDEARLLVADVGEDARVIDALCETACRLGILSLRAPVFALRVARACAALAGRSMISDDDLAAAVCLVLAPRATVVPTVEPPPPPPPDSGEEEPPPPQDEKAQGRDDLADVLLEAALASLPPGLLAALAEQDKAKSGQTGRAGATKAGTRRGRPSGVERGDPRSGARLAIVDTLRAAAPWQQLRQQGQSCGARRVIVHADDFRTRRFAEHTETATIFAVDASGSLAFHRLAEAKGAVELLLADCYVRRDQVALVSFRRTEAELLLPPSRSLVRAKRALAALPGGGGTPLAAGIDAALALAEALRRRGQSPLVVLLTDGRANIGRDGQPGRDKATADALASARRLAESRVGALVIDTSPRPHPSAGDLAAAMHARYLPLPQAGAAQISAAVRSAHGEAA